MPEYITVTAPKGRKAPIHPSDGSDPEGGLLFVTDERVCRVRYSGDVRRALRDGDLIPVKLEENIDSKGVATYRVTKGRASVEEADSPTSLANGDRVDLVENPPPSVRPDRAFDKFRASVDARATPNTDASRLPAFDTSDKE